MEVLLRDRVVLETVEAGVIPEAIGAEFDVAVADIDAAHNTLAAEERAVLECFSTRKPEGMSDTSGFNLAQLPPPPSGGPNAEVLFDDVNIRFGALVEQIYKEPSGEHLGQTTRIPQKSRGIGDVSSHADWYTPPPPA